MKKNLWLVAVGVAIVSALPLTYPILLGPLLQVASKPNHDQISTEQHLLISSASSKSQVSRNSEASNSSRVLYRTPSLLSESSENSLPKTSVSNFSKQDFPNQADEVQFYRITEYAIEQKLYERPMGEIMQALAQQLLGAKYKAGLLDQSNQETLVVSLTKFDCVLFVETVLALARGVVAQDYSSQTFLNRIEDQRYWNGYMNGYCSRLHYFSEWVADNQRRGNVENITRYLGETAVNKKLNFMSHHRGSYSRLANNRNYKCIVEMEANIPEVTVNYVPQNRIRRVYGSLQPGDIVAVVTNISGLDVTHTGLVYRHPDGSISLIHASPIGEVTISQDLQSYVGKIKNAIGILVARPADPRQKNPSQ